MSSLQRATTTEAEIAKPLATALDQEADELEAIRTGLLRHLDAWRGAHDATIQRLADIIARMDALLTRIEQDAA